MNQKLNQLADLHSVTCLLNSLFREYEEYTIYRYLDETHVLISLSKDEIQIPLSRFSILGRHQYTGKFYLKTSHGITSINFESLLDHLCEKLTNVLNIPDEKITHFKQDVLSSRQNIRDALEIQDLSYDPSTDFITAEQALIIGHNFHPTPKSRDVLTTSELKNYAPEFKGNFYLDWILVDAKIIQQTNADSFENCQWLTHLFLEEFPGSIDEIQEGMLPVPMHPWQWQFLQKSPVIIEYLHTKQIIYFKPSVQKWSATSSLRTIYRDRCSYMLKFSISIRLTNSLRVLIGSEVKRGLLLHDVLNSRPGQEFQQAFPNFHIITEPASVCLLDTHGEPMENTMIICRENPFQGDNAQNQFMLATLVQDNPFGGDNLILTLLKNNCSNIDIPLHQKLKKWFAAYLLIAIKPFITAYVKYGIIMEGHQQNMVLKLENAYPVAAYFRDCQDHAYSEYGYNLFGDTVPSVKENPSCVADRVIGCEYFIYQVILNSTFNVITTLAQGNHISEKELLADLHHFLQEIAKDGLNDHFCLDKLLNNAFLLHKCNVRFALQRFNDNQLDFNPLDLYKPVPNLIRASQYPIAKEYYKKILYQRYFESIQKTITLRVAHSEFDLEKFIVWQKNPRVAKYWQLEESEEAEIYFKKMADEPYHQAIIIEINHELAGYGEIYWAAKDPVAEHYAYDNHDRGFHLLIGEDHLLGVNSTTCIFMAIMHYLYLDDAATKRIVIEPDVRNYQFIKYMKIIPGWHFQKEVDFPEKRAALFLSQREYFQLEGV